MPLTWGRSNCQRVDADDLPRQEAETKEARMKRVADSPRKFKREMPKGYEFDLDRVIDIIYEEAYRRDWSWADLARFAGLCYHTVWMIGERRTRFPAHMTIFKLSKAVQLRVTFERTRASVVKDKSTA
jgi:hypothetical protein